MTALKSAAVTLSTTNAVSVTVMEYLPGIVTVMAMYMTAMTSAEAVQLSMTAVSAAV